MKRSLIFVSVIISITLVCGQGIPTKNCPLGEHSVLYCPQMAEPSCDNPTVHDLPPGVPKVCDIPQCFCDRPTVRNTQTGECVDFEFC